MTQDFRYFRAATGSGVTYYRMDPAQTDPAKQFRTSEDGLWTASYVRSLADLELFARGVEEIEVEAVPCHLCMLVEGTVTRLLVAEWPEAIAITPRPNPVVEGHVVVVPRQHVKDATVNPVIAAAVRLRAAELARDLRIPFHNYVDSTGRAATQTEPHLHGNIIPRHSGDGLALPWTPKAGGSRG